MWEVIKEFAVNHWMIWVVFTAVAFIYVIVDEKSGNQILRNHPILKGATMMVSGLCLLGGAACLPIFLACTAAK